MTDDRFHRKPWRVDWFEPELEFTKTAKPCLHAEDYSEDVTLYFGDLHTHTSLSPCANLQAFNPSLEESYEHARDIAHTDFLAITDHAERLTPAEWGRSMALARMFNEPGEFVAWPAVEWANGLHGHRNVYYRGYDVPLITGETHPTPRRLWAALRELQTPACTVPHHAAKELIADLTVTDDKLEPAYEIFSVWGNEEYYGAPLQDTDRCFTRNFAVDTLLRGFRMGFVGGGDGHPAPPAESGITGIYARELTLEALFEALMQRRTIATTGAQIRVDFHVNGFPMGSVLRFNQNDLDELFPLEIGVAVQGTANLEKVEIVENGVTVHTKTKPRRLDQMGFVWSSGAAPANARFRVPNNVSRFIYVRVTQRDGHMAWTSPVWLDFYYDE
jgi:hypothetical protein